LALPMLQGRVSYHYGKAASCMEGEVNSVA
jgi:hypothetical protein